MTMEVAAIAGMVLTTLWGLGVLGLALWSARHNQAHHKDTLPTH